MKYQLTLNLFNSLNNTSLKNKNLSSDNYISIHLMKVKLKKYLTDINEAEISLCKDFDIKDGEQFPLIKDKPDFWDKLEKIREPEITFDKLNFIEIEEFRKWIDDVPANFEFILAENLLKQ